MEVVSPAAPTAPAAPAVPSAPPTVAPSAPAGETPAAASETTSPAPAGETPAKPDDADKSDRARHRRQLNTAYRKAAEAQARAEFFEKQYNEARSKAAPAEDPGAPKLEQFKDIEEYAAAREKYASDKALREQAARQHSESQKQRIAQLTEGWETKIERAVTKYDDFDEVVGDVKPTTPWAVAMMEADNAEDIAYYLGKNLKEAHRIAALPPLSQIREIGKIEAKLLAEPPKPKTPSRAPAPITPVTGASQATSQSLYDPNLPYDDFVKIRNKQLGRK